MEDGIWNGLQKAVVDIGRRRITVRGVMAWYSYMVYGILNEEIRVLLVVGRILSEGR